MAHNAWKKVQNFSISDGLIRPATGGQCAASSSTACNTHVKVKLHSRRVKPNFTLPQALSQRATIFDTEMAPEARRRLLHTKSDVVHRRRTEVKCCTGYEESSGVHPVDVPLWCDRYRRRKIGAEVRKCRFLPFSVRTSNAISKPILKKMGRFFFNISKQNLTGYKVGIVAAGCCVANLFLVALVFENGSGRNFGKMPGNLKLFTGLTENSFRYISTKFQLPSPSKPWANSEFPKNYRYQNYKSEILRFILE